MKKLKYLNKEVYPLEKEPKMKNLYVTSINLVTIYL